MPNYSSYLNLIKPFLGEFPDSWDQPWADNMDKVDVFCQELDKALVSGGGTTALYSSLKGSMSSLAARLAVSIYNDGTLNLDNSPSIAGLSSSAVNGVFTSPRDRFDYEEFEIWRARSPSYDARFTIAPVDQGFLDEGLAVRNRDGWTYTGSIAMASPQRSAGPGMIQGPSSWMSGVAPNQVAFNASIGNAASWVIFNIDGYVFRIREGVVLDMAQDSAGTALANGDFVYLFVQRTDYNNAYSKVKLVTDGGSAAARNLTQLQSGSDGVLSGSNVFSSASAAFSGSSSKWKVLPGDCLVITGGTAAGRYLVSAVPTANTLTIRGVFKATSLSGVSWYVEDQWHPNIGCIKVTDAYSDPPAVRGRVYVGRGVLNAANFKPVSTGTVIDFPVGGVYDTGFYAADVATTFPMKFEHNLGVMPTHVDLWVRESLATDEYEPLILREIPAASGVKFRTRSVVAYADKQFITVMLATAGTAVPALFTKSDNVTDVTSGLLRVIARR